MKRQTVIIGIPAFNEEANILHLLHDIAQQNTSGFIIKKIIVASDNSSDKTTSLVKNYKCKTEIIIIDGKKREGQAVRQNEIFKKSDSDILVLLNADTQIKDHHFIKKLIAPIVFNGADLTSSFPIPLQPEGFVENILYTSVTMKTRLFESYKAGQNIYTCHGRARAFSKKLYQKMEFTDSIGEDAYSYVYAKTHGFIYKSVSSAKIYYKLPNTFSDHKSQSIRFMKTKEMLSNTFGKEKVESEFRLPITQTLTSVCASFIKAPVKVSLYLLVFGLLKAGLFSKTDINNTWKISHSSKNLRRA